MNATLTKADTSAEQSDKTNPVTLIAGCGDVGGRLALRLLEAGHTVYGLRRSIESLPEGVKALQGDLATGEWDEWPEHIDYVVYAAAAGRSGEEGYRKTYVDGLGHVLAKIKAYPHPPRRTFFTSSTAVYHQRDGEWIDELSETHPQTFNGQIMLEAEGLLLNSDLPATVVRFGGIYGPGRNFMLRKVMGGEVYASEPVAFGNRIHADDCAGILEQLISLDLSNECVHPLYLGVDCDPAPLSDVTQWLAEQVNVQPESEIPGGSRGSKRCRNQRVIESGYDFLYPSYREGYKTILGDI
ncbi:SDR family oxidoreductase [Parendozoicomonas haliclonae]|uniref:NAD-dependent epimerase/dehydratase domain-containing protein n=1 Tax=Parendozoicomonas haliclonae TaxID=1960125 RepID=A0A1X7APR1_9GAMM|nr:SDR family oxidoreductase [Parendozoicomonas haliclonae]SMA50304.1 hypothetical protein EHSB41UT_04098 [Parendozoicomonas haliclonae]